MMEGIGADRASTMADRKVVTGGTDGKTTDVTSDRRSNHTSSVVQASDTLQRFFLILTGAHIREASDLLALISKSQNRKPETISRPAFIHCGDVASA